MTNDSLSLVSLVSAFSLFLYCDEQRGAKSFYKNWLSSHRFNDMGFDVGPNLATLISPTRKRVTFEAINRSLALRACIAW